MANTTTHTETSQFPSITSVQEESEITELLDEESSTSTTVRNKTREHLCWRFASNAYIWGFRFIKKVSHDYAKQKSYREIVNASSDTVLNVEIDPTILSQLVEDKDLDQLQELGGVDGIAAALKTDLKHGIQVEDEELYREVFGANTLENSPKEKRFFQFVWRALLDTRFFVCLFIVIISGSVFLGLDIKVRGRKKSRDSEGIAISVIIAVIFVAIIDFWRHNVFEKLRKDSSNRHIDVVRGGRRQQIPVFEIVVGDVVCLKGGDKVPAHGLVFKVHSLKLEVDKVSNKDPFVFSGTKVVDGFAKMLVTSVGMKARRGEMARHEGNDLQDWLEEFSKLIDWIDYVVALVFLTKGIPKTSFEENEKASLLAKIYAIVGILVVTTVVNIPDPLMLFFRLTHAYAMKKLKADNAVVCESPALETMGFVTTICINKTGTLATMNQMKVTKFWLGKDFLEGTYLLINPEVKKLLIEGIALNTILTCPTEKAILYWAFQDLEMDMEEIKRSHDILYIEALSSRRKQSWILAQRKAHKTIQVHLKGAAELILAMCSCYYDYSGKVRDLDHRQKMEFDKIVRDMADSSLSCIAFAHKEVEAKELHEIDKLEMLKDGMVLLAIVGIRDPFHPARVKDGVKELQNAQVSIKMITGEDIPTAEAIAIAIECGVLTPDSGAVIEGMEFQNYTPEERENKVDEICVMARSSPSHVRLMVECLKQKERVVAVIEQADIGLSMRIQGSEVTEDESYMVILDGKFNNIPKVLMWARCAYSSIQKFIQFNLTACFSALLANFVGFLIDQELTLTTIQLVVVSLITDLLACLAFATEKPTKELMNKPPVSSTNIPHVTNIMLRKPTKELMNKPPVSSTNIPHVTNIMLRNILPQALYQTTLLILIIQSKGTSIIFSEDDTVPVVTFTFTSYVLCQVFSLVNARTLETKNVFENIQTNKLFLAIIAIIILLLILFVEILSMIADTQRLNWSQWGWCVGIGSLTLPIGWVLRFIPVPEEPEVVNYLMYLMEVVNYLKEQVVNYLYLMEVVNYLMYLKEQVVNYLMEVVNYLYLMEVVNYLKEQVVNYLMQVVNYLMETDQQQTEESLLS